MPTIDELKARIIAETNRDDMGAGGELEALFAGTVARAVEHHADELFWFNQATEMAIATPEIDKVALPPGVRLALDVAWVGRPLRQAALETVRALAGFGEPALWAEEDKALRLWPVPDRDYILFVTGIAELGVPDNVTASSNAWTEEGADLIAARTRMLLYRDALRDVDGYRLAAEAEAEALAKLRRETRRRCRFARTSDMPIGSA